MASLVCLRHGWIGEFTESKYVLDVADVVLVRTLGTVSETPFGQLFALRRKSKNFQKLVLESIPGGESVFVVIVPDHRRVFEVEINVSKFKRIIPAIVRTRPVIVAEPFDDILGGCAGKQWRITLTACNGR